MERDVMETEEKIATGALAVDEAESSMRKAGLFFFLLMILEIPVSFLVGMVQRGLPVDSASLASILITQGYLLAGAFVYILVAKPSFTDDLQIRKYRVSTFFLSIVLLMTASPMASWLNVLSQFFAKNETSTAIYDVTQKVPVWMGVLIIGCLPGLVEETLYRGILFGAFRKRSVLTGIIISALSFGLMHMNFNQISYAVYLGVIFALLVEATGSLLSTMILHMLFNAVNTCYIYLLPVLYEWLGRFNAEYANFDIEAAFAQTPETSQLAALLVMLTPFAAGGLVLTVLLLRAIAKINGRPFTWAYIKGEREQVKQTKPVNVFLIIGWVFCMLIAAMNLL